MKEKDFLRFGLGFGMWGGDLHLRVEGAGSQLSRTWWLSKSESMGVTSSSRLVPHPGNALRALSGPLAVESSIVVEDAVENRGLYRVFVSHFS